jgi:LL-diaminopimelate aminotransferase
MKSTAGRMSHLAPHFFAALSARLQALQSEGRDIIRLDEGAPDLPPAPHILDALFRSAARPDTHSYQPHRGPRSLRQAWSDAYRRLYAVDLDPEGEIIPLLGSKEGIFHLSLAFIEPGDVALVPDPGYITYTRGALVAAGEVFRMPLLPERGYLPDLDALPPEILQRAKLMWLNYPNNPTAAVADLKFFTQAVELAREHGFLLCHDAAYMQVAFDGEQPPSLLQAAGAKDVAVEFNTLSKSHNMAGWRSAALLGNPYALRALHTLKTNADSSHFLPVFEASTAALTGDQSWLLERNEIYRQRRDVVVAGLRQMGLAAALPRASLYVWSPVPAGWNSIAFATAALEQAGVSLTPGTVFGPGGEGFVRISITVPVERVRLAMDRLGEWLARPWSPPPAHKI